MMELKPEFGPDTDEEQASELLEIALHILEIANSGAATAAMKKALDHFAKIYKRANYQTQGYYHWLWGLEMKKPA